MDRGAKTGGTIKCRKFTRMVNFSQTTQVISAVLRGALCLRRPPRRTNDYGWFFPRAAILRQYSTWAWLACSTLLAFHPGYASAQTPTAKAQDSVIETGTASYYGRAHQGRRTASGSRFDEAELTAAHPWLPFGSRIRVTLLGTTRSVVVVVTDRLHARRRVIDLSLSAARALGMLNQGLAKVTLSPA